MAQTYQKIQRQIEALQREAEKLKSQEIAGVIQRIKTAIDHYGLTEEQLGFGISKARTAKAPKPSQAAAKKTGRGSGARAYSDENGNVWGGRGPRPHWLRNALLEGRSLEEFLTTTPPKEPKVKRAEPAVKTVASAKRKKQVRKPRKSASVATTPESPATVEQPTS